MKKVALFAFNGELTCFVHVLLNALDLNERGHHVKIVIEGAATRLVPELAQEGNPMGRLYEKAKGLDLIDGVCKACAGKMGTLEDVKVQGLRLLDEMTGHPSMARYMEEGFEIICF
jgi:hypothetical protein